MYAQSSYTTLIGVYEMHDQSAPQLSGYPMITYTCMYIVASNMPTKSLVARQLHTHIPWSSIKGRDSIVHSIHLLDKVTVDSIIELLQ